MLDPGRGRGSRGSPARSLRRRGAGRSAPRRGRQARRRGGAARRADHHGVRAGSSRHRHGPERLPAYRRSAPRQGRTAGRLRIDSLPAVRGRRFAARQAERRPIAPVGTARRDRRRRAPGRTANPAGTSTGCSGSTSAKRSWAGWPPGSSTGSSSGRRWRTTGCAGTSSITGSRTILSGISPRPRAAGSSIATSPNRPRATTRHGSPASPRRRSSTME